MTERLKLIQERLQEAPALLDAIQVTAGLDGFVDSIVKVIAHKSKDEGAVYFQTIDEFGAYISGKKGSGFSIETEELFQRLGGNMPIMANALAQMGAKVNCVGAFGLPAIVPAFAAMHPNCSIHSFSNPGLTTAMEFNDGKMMVAQMSELNNADWDTLKRIFGLQKLQDLFVGSKLICLVNWSELDHSSHIWEGLQREVFRTMESLVPRRFFFDLSDCSKRSAADIETAIRLIKDFGQFGEVILSLNKNESNVLYRTIIDSNVPAEAEHIGERLFMQLHVDTLIIHSARKVLAWDKGGAYSSVPDYIAEPFMLTGAGDNFNAGYCLAQLLDFDQELSLMFANMVSNNYIQTGKSPDIATLATNLSGLQVENPYQLK